MTSKKTETQTQTRTTTRVPTETRSQDLQLTWEEEMTVRMSHGLSESADHALEFRGQLHGELRARLGMMEAELMEAMFQRGPMAQPKVEAPAVDAEGRARILAQLARLHGSGNNEER